jgi:hypothetical protein
MNKNKIIDKLDELSLETEMLVEVLDNALKLKQYEGDHDTYAFCFLAGKIRKKLTKMRNLF